MVDFWLQKDESNFFDKVFARNVCITELISYRTASNYCLISELFVSLNMFRLHSLVILYVTVWLVSEVVFLYYFIFH